VRKPTNTTLLQNVGDIESTNKQFIESNNQANSIPSSESPPLDVQTDPEKENSLPIPQQTKRGRGRPRKHQVQADHQPDLTSSVPVEQPVFSSHTPETTVATPSSFSEAQHHARPSRARCRAKYYDASSGMWI